MIYEFNSILNKVKDQAPVEKDSKKEVIKEEKKKSSITEAYKRSSLPDSEFGLPDQRKYPMHDKKHVLLAIRMFNYVPEDDKKSQEILAKNIIKKAIQYHIDLNNDIHIGKDNRFLKYYTQNESAILESINKDIKPVYIVTVFTGTSFGKIIKAATGDAYSHAAVGFDSSLENLYTFNAASKLGKNGGLSIESLTGYKNENPDGDLQVTTVFVKEKDYNILQEKLSWIKEHASETMYDWCNIFNIVLHRAKTSLNGLSMICSEFVEYLFNLINVDLTDKSANLTTPGDLSRIDNPKAYKIYQGKIKHYNSKHIDKKINKMLPRVEPIKEMVIYEKGDDYSGLEIKFADKETIDLMMSSPYEDFKKEVLASPDVNVYIHGKDAIDSKLKNHMEKYDAKKEEEILKSKNIVEEYNIYVNAQFDKILSLKENERDGLEYNISEMYKGLVNTAGIDKEKVRNYLINRFFDISDDPKHIQALLKLRLNYNRKMINIFKEMLRQNYSILGLTEAEANERIKLLNSSPDLGVKEVKGILLKNESKFKNGDCLDLSSLGFGKLFATRRELGPIKDLANIDNIIQFLMRYDCVIISHGDDVFDDYDTKRYKDKLDAGVKIKGQQNNLFKMDNYMKIEKEFLDTKVKDLSKIDGFYKTDFDLISRFITRCCRSCRSEFDKYSLEKTIEHNLEKKYLYHYEDKQVADKIIKGVKDLVPDILELNKKFKEVDLSERKSEGMIKSFNKNANKYRNASVKAEKKGAETIWTMQSIKSDKSGYFTEMNPFLRELKKEGYKKIYVICCNPGHHKLDDDLEKDHSIYIKYSPDILMAESTTADIEDCSEEFAYDLNNSIDYTIYEMECNLKAIAESNNIDYNNDVLLEQSYYDVFEDCETLNEGVLSTLWQGVVALAKKVLEALIALFKKIIEFFKGVLIRIRNFFVGKKTISYELNGKVQYIAMEGASMKELSFTTYSDMESKILSSCENIGKEIKKLSDQQPKITEEIKKNAEKLAAQQTNESAALNENYFLSKKNMEFNMDKWNLKDKKILFITGLSGSGKSTFAEKLEKENNAIRVSLDLFEQNWLLFKEKDKYAGQGFDIMRKYIHDVFKTDGINIIKDMGISEFIKQFDLFFDFIIRKLNSINKLSIIEGVQLYNNLSDKDMNRIKDYPLIIIGTSALKSCLRAANRDEVSPKYILQRLKDYYKSDKQLGEFRDKMNESVVSEAKDFPIQFNDDGDLLIKNYKKINHETEYYKSVKLLKSYKAVDNIEGVKFELAKLWFELDVLSKKINSTKTSEEDRTSYLKLKGKMNNSFAQYLKWVSLKEPNFNFAGYYHETPFSDTEIRISGATLDHSIKLLKKIL